MQIRGYYLEIANLEERDLEERRSEKTNPKSPDSKAKIALPITSFDELQKKSTFLRGLTTNSLGRKTN
ncbi:hypothetical protein AO498_13565 [Algoriphagus sanaruensis]|uniref:Uncharacterized protein n=1 Tax=Algoriphagus sanaruensis TaxID=1727163 RepID=A0A142EQR6_9BACT|nr:hypothetical protein AO498_13565 [Algoriphagus sanaruensis]